MNLVKLKKEARSLADLDRVVNYQKFFKTKPNFIGLNVPTCRQLAKKYQNLDFKDLKTLINSHYHEHKLIAIFILILQYRKADEIKKKKIVNFYLKHISQINNWDLVDSSAYQILGDYLLNNKKERKILYQFSKSDNLWKRRIAIVSTLAFIKNNQLSDTFKLAKVLMNDREVLVCQACGWLLREAGKKDEKQLLNFLKKYYKLINRRTLSYSLEKFKEKERGFLYSSLKNNC